MLKQRQYKTTRIDIIQNTPIQFDCIGYEVENTLNNQELKALYKDLTRTIGDIKSTIIEFGIDNGWELIEDLINEAVENAADKLDKSYSACIQAGATKHDKLMWYYYSVIFNTMLYLQNRYLKLLTELDESLN